MANEDARESSVLGGALKIAAIGGAAYLGVKGGRGLIKNYDDLGAKFGKAGDKATKNIDKFISKFDNADGTAGGFRKGINEAQDKILNKDYSKTFEKGTDLFKEANPSIKNVDNLREKAFNDSHDIFKGKSAKDKRAVLENQGKYNDDLKEKIAQNAKAKAEAEKVAKATTEATKEGAENTTKL